MLHFLCWNGISTNKALPTPAVLQNIRSSVHLGDWPASNLTIIGSDKGLSPGRCQGVIWTKDVGYVVEWVFHTNTFSYRLCIGYMPVEKVIFFLSEQSEVLLNSHLNKHWWKRCISWVTETEPSKPYITLSHLTIEKHGGDISMITLKVFLWEHGFDIFHREIPLNWWFFVVFCLIIRL